MDRLEPPIAFNGPHVSSRQREHGGQIADTSSDLHDFRLSVGRRGPRNLVKQIIVDEEVLTQAAFQAQAMAFQEFTNSHGLDQFHTQRGCKVQILPISLICRG